MLLQQDDSRIIEIYGPESSGKTTLAIHAIAEAQKAGGIAAFIDAEHAFDRFYVHPQGLQRKAVQKHIAAHGQAAAAYREQTQAAAVVKGAAANDLHTDSSAL